MKLIVGLGNPGKQYETTRHNLGFLFIDFLKTYTSPLTPLLNKRKEYDFSDFKYESKFKGDLSIGKIYGEKVILFKPTTFMNLSGEAIKLISKYYNIDTTDIIIIYDDISMEFGKLRFRNTGSAGGHNGIKSIIKYFGNDFNRLKIGVGYDEKYEVSDWVLSKFTKNELEELNNNIFDKSYELLEEYIKPKSIH